MFKSLFSQSKEWCFNSPSLLKLSQFFKDHPEEKARYLTYLGYLFACLAYADGAFSKSELIEIETVLDNDLELTRNESQQMSKLIKEECKSVDPEKVDQVLAAYSEIASKAQQQLFINALTRISGADSLHPSEQEFIQRVEKTLGLSASV